VPSPPEGGEDSSFPRYFFKSIEIVGDGSYNIFSFAAKCDNYSPQPLWIKD
jgi:hypothetical protein